MTQLAPTRTRPSGGPTGSAHAGTRAERRASHAETVGPRAFRLGVAACAAFVAAILLLRVSGPAPHEDEALALLLGRESLGDLLAIVLEERGGAPLHFLFAWLVAHAGGGLTELRLGSALFAVASVPTVAVLARRLAGRTVGLSATVLASASWLLLFHGVFGRMYTLFLLTSALSYVALLTAPALGRRGWALWALAALATVASHPYGALVLATQLVFVLLRRERVREALVAFTVVVLAGIPFWRTDAVLADRYEVAVGGDGSMLHSPLSVLGYLARVAGDVSAVWRPALAVVLVLAAYGLVRLWRERPRAAVLTAIVFALPAAALLVARAGGSSSPETRHLIFALPFFCVALAAGAVDLARRSRHRSPLAIVAVLAALASLEIASAHEKGFFADEAAAKLGARRAASAWLAETARRDDVLFGYDPVYAEAANATRRLSRLVVPRADAVLARAALERARQPLGHGVWVVTAENGRLPRRAVARALGGRFGWRLFGPFLVVRTDEPVRDARTFLRATAKVQRLGAALGIEDAVVSYRTALAALALARQEAPTAASPRR